MITVPIAFIGSNVEILNKDSSSLWAFKKDLMDVLSVSWSSLLAYSASLSSSLFMSTVVLTFSEVDILACSIYQFASSLGIIDVAMKLCALSIVGVARFLLPNETIWSFASGKTPSNRGSGRYPHCTYGLGWGKSSCYLKILFLLATVFRTLMDKAPEN